MSILRSKNKQEAVTNISSRLNVPDEWKDAIISSLIEYGKSRTALKKYPSFVETHNKKPSFHLDDGSLLYMWSIRFSRANDKLKVKYTPVKYGGSADSVFYHQGEQLSSGQSAPEDTVGIFVTEHASVSTRIWSVDIWAGEQSKKPAIDSYTNSSNTPGHRSDSQLLSASRPSLLTIRGFYPEDAEEIKRRTMRVIDTFIEEHGYRYSLSELSDFSKNSSEKGLLRILLPKHITVSDSIKLTKWIENVVLPGFAPPSIEVSVDVD
jgi:hypothetical protein